MAELQRPALSYPGGCPDCGERTVVLPQPLPPLGDDFDWRVRDYDGFRLFMMEELAARFPERARFTPADLEVVIVEALAAVLDQLSDQLDRVAAEAYLDSARQPESLRRLLKLIGYDALQLALDREEIARRPGESADGPEVRQRLASYWLAKPYRMEAARQAGPRLLHRPHRMATVEDYALRLEEHPLVLRAQAWSEWTGSWTTIRIAVIGWSNSRLDEVPGYDADLLEKLDAFYDELGLPQPALGSKPSIRTVLAGYLDAYRMAGQEVQLADAVPVGVAITLSVRVAPTHFQSELRQALAQVLGRGPEGFFQPGRLRFGEDLHASDLIAAVMSVDGVETVCLNRFKRLGGEFADQVASGVIRLAGLEVAICDNDPKNPSRGSWRLTLHGGLPG